MARGFAKLDRPMRRRSWIQGFFLTGLGLVSPARGAAKRRSAYAVRALRRGDGARTSLAAAAAGHRLVVVVMKGTWCPVCIKQLRRLGALDKALKGLGVRVVGLTHESFEKASKLRKERSLKHPILSDPKHEVLSLLGLWRAQWGHPVPAMVVFDRCGKERGRISGRAPGERPERALLRFLKKLAERPERCNKINA